MRKFLSYVFLLSLTIFFISACGTSGLDSTGDSSPTYVTIFQLRPDIGNGQVTLEWLSDSTTATYNIYVGTSESSLAKVAANVVSAPYTVTGLTNNTTYYFSVSGTNGSSQEGPLAVPVAATPISSPPPAAPENVRANAGDQHITVTWTPVNASPAVTSYNIYCQWQTTLTDMGQAVATVNGQTSNSAVINAGTITWPFYPPTDGNLGIVNDRVYTCWASAVNSNNLESSLSFPSVVTPSATPPPMAPTGLHVEQAGDSFVNIHWDDVPGATSYNIYVGIAKNVTTLTAWYSQAGDTLSGYVLPGLNNGYTYYFIVTAVNANGESAASAEVAGTPSAP